MNNIWKTTLASLQFFQSRIFAAGLLAAVFSMTVYATTDAINTIYIHDSALDEAIILHTAQDDIQAILKNEGIEIGPDDEVYYKGLQDRLGEIYINRAFEVSIQADGGLVTVPMTGGTVRDALQKAGISISNEDLINMEPSEFLREGDRIVINRVSYRTIQQEEEIPFEEEIRQTPLLRNGRVETLQSGSSGAMIKTYIQRTVDGIVEEAALESEHVVKAPVKQISLVGADVPVSDLDFGYEIVNNAPTSYKRVIRGARAAGYSAGGRARGSSGNALTYGHVAVNPDVIPYNSKLYITSADGSFVYGYAIASDTGVALMNGVIDVDLFYDTYRESQLNGIRNVNIYILE